MNTTNQILIDYDRFTVYIYEDRGTYFKRRYDSILGVELEFKELLNGRLVDVLPIFSGVN